MEKLDGEALIEFVRRCLHFLPAGALPVVSRGDGDWFFVPVDTYGTTPDAIVETILAEWIGAGMLKPGWDDYAFTMPRNIDPDVLARFRAGETLDV